MEQSGSEQGVSIGYINGAMFVFQVSFFSTLKTLTYATWALAREVHVALGAVLGGGGLGRSLSFLLGHPTWADRAVVAKPHFLLLP